MRKNNRVSSKDVAREAGVSQATVSYVLNNNPNVKIRPETREDVLRAAKKLNYHVNYIARNMRLRRSGSIGIVTNTKISNHVFMETLEGIKDTLDERSYSLTVCFGDYDDIHDAEFIKYYYSNLVDGLIFVFCDLKDEDVKYLEENSIPHVTVNANTLESSQHQIKTDMKKACVDAVADLVAGGCGSVGYIGQYAGDQDSVRFSSFVEAMKENKLEIVPEFIHKAKGKEGEVESQVAEYVSRDNLPQGIICDSILSGFFTMRHLQKAGKNIPNDVSVVLLGTSVFNKRIYPAFSAVEAPLYTLGVRGSRYLFEILDQGSTAINENIVIEWSYNKRESTRS